MEKLNPPDGGIFLYNQGSHSSLCLVFLIGLTSLRKGSGFIVHGTKYQASGIGLQASGKSHKAESYKAAML